MREHNISDSTTLLEDSRKPNKQLRGSHLIDLGVHILSFILVAALVCFAYACMKAGEARPKDRYRDSTVCNSTFVKGNLARRNRRAKSEMLWRVL